MKISARMVEEAQQRAARMLADGETAVEVRDEVAHSSVLLIREDRAAPFRRLTLHRFVVDGVDFALVVDF